MIEVKELELFTKPLTSQKKYLLEMFSLMNGWISRKLSALLKRERCWDLQKEL